MISGLKGLTLRECASACLLHSTAISIVSESSSSFSEVSSNKVFYLVRKLCTYTIQKNIRWSWLFILLWAKKNTNCLLAKSDFVFSSIVTTNIQKTLEFTNTGAEHA